MRSEDSNGSYIQLPTPVFFALVGAITFGGAGIYGAVTPGNSDQLRAVIEDVSTAKEHARSALTLSTQNGQRINDNRQLIYDTTRDRYLSTEADADWRDQDARDSQIERRLMLIERELDKLRGN